MGRKQQIAPDPLDLFGILTDQPGNQCLAQQRHHGRTAGADGIGIAGALRPIRVDDRDQRGFLTDKTLDRIGAPGFRDQIHHANLNAGDAGHGLLLTDMSVYLLMQNPRRSTHPLFKGAP